MKRYIALLLIPVIFGFSSVIHAADTYKIDPRHTYILWHINHLGFSEQTGKWYAQGTLIFDKASPNKSKVNITVNVSDVVSGNEELNKHLRGKLFFETEKFPTATFISDKISANDLKTAVMQGRLTLHGVTKPVTLNVTINKQGKNPINNKDTIGFKATTSIKRSDFGMTTMLQLLGDDISLEIQGEANK